MNTKQYPDTARYAVYILGGLPFLPHYLRKGWYVAPGYAKNGLEYSANQLKAAGAIREHWELWKRGQHD